MKISYNWLLNILDFKLSAKLTEELLTDIGLEVEKSEVFESIPGGLDGLVIGEVLTVDKHPNADRLNVTTVNVGKQDPYTIVCGAPNVAKNQKVVIALPGTTIYPISGEPFKIKKAKIRGVESFGMICAEDEIGVGQSHDGIIVINEKVSVGKRASEYYNISSDTIFEIGLTPNRADAMSHYGVARDLLAALQFKEEINSDKKLLPLPKFNQIKYSSDENVSVEILDSKKCLRYSGIVIKEINVAQSPEWLQKKLDSIGVKTINNIVDITNFILHDLGQPLHAFDLNQINNKTIKVRCPKKDTPFITLDGNERKLSQDDLMICDDNKEMCIAGVFGGINSGVQSTTTEIFIESALFNPVSTRKTAKRHGLNTDASFRYERGVDPEMVIPALVKATQMIIELAGGKVSSEIIDVHPIKTENISFKINFNSIRKLCGFSLENEQMVNLLSFLDISSKIENDNQATVTVPAFRNDVTREADIAEEILRIYGYNNIDIPKKINSSPNFTTVKNSIALQQLVSNHLSSLGGFEILSNSLSKKSYSEILNSTKKENQTYVQLLNPLSNDTEVLRQSLVYNALEVIKYNQQNGESNCNIYEWGKTYQLKNDKYKEEEHLLIAISGLQNDEHWFNGKQKSSFHQLKGLVESIFKMLGIYFSSDIFSDFSSWAEGLNYTNNKTNLARIGIINPNLSQEIGLKEDCFVAEINWQALLNLVERQKVKFKPINKFQKVFRDLSILIEENVEMKDILNCINKLKIPILKSVSLFDIYRDKKNMEGKKSYGLRFEFLHSDRTLKDNEVDKIMQSIQKNITNKVGASFR